MDSHVKNPSEIIQSYLDVLSSDIDSFKMIPEALKEISPLLHIGRVMGDIKESENENEMNLLEENRIIFTSNLGFDPSQSFVYPFKTVSGADGIYITLATPGHVFTEEEKQIIINLIKISDIHIARFFAINEIEESSLKNVLTGLPNANGYLKKAARKFSNNTIDQFDAYYFNLKGFGLINKRFGQKEGDNIITRYAEELKKFFRPEEMLGHLGGDNFVALVTKGERSKQFQQYISGIDVEGLHSDGEKIKMRVSASAGMMPVVLPLSIDRIIGGPAIALARAKRNKTSLVILTEELNDEAIRAKAIEQGFEKSLANGEFTVFYQPKVNSVTGEIIGAEALTRWFENGRMVPPMAFVPVLEQSGKINKLDLNMLEIVCKDISDWKSLGRKAVPISVNFSRRDLNDSELSEKIMKVIDKYGVSKDEIIIEVTETASEEEAAQMVHFLNKLHEYGIETSIDDFGTGYSSLSVLREYPIGEVKIDRSFINRQLGQKDEIIIRSIIEMAKKLNIDVITEGVELVEQMKFLHELGCDRIQGFLYDKPLPKNQFEKRLAEGKYILE